MKKQKDIQFNTAPATSVYSISGDNNLISLKDEQLKNRSATNSLVNNKLLHEDMGHCQLKSFKTPGPKKESLLYKRITDDEIITTGPASKHLFRFFVKNGEHIYGRANDIVMIESCNHLVTVYLGIDNKIKKTIRTNTLKDFLLQLPPENFVRISRFCAINIQRLSGGNWNDQTFEFDFKISVKIKHTLSQAIFKNIGR